MKATITLGLLLVTSAFAHPGSPGHYHPDEVDEFDQITATTARHESDFGGTLVLTGIAACLAYAFFQKESGIWKDTTTNH